MDFSTKRAHRNGWDHQLRNFLVISFVLISSLAKADPWVMSGQTQIDAGTSIDNPVPANSGAIGQVTSLPYTVPAGKVVCVKAYGMEGYNEAGIAVLYIWTGAPQEVDYPMAEGSWAAERGGEQRL